jgi:hypothetical protein
MIKKQKYYHRVQRGINCGKKKKHREHRGKAKNVVFSVLKIWGWSCVVSVILVFS